MATAATDVEHSPRPRALGVHDLPPHVLRLRGSETRRIAVSPVAREWPARRDLAVSASVPARGSPRTHGYVAPGPGQYEVVPAPRLIREHSARAGKA